MSLKFYYEPISQPCRAVQCLLELLEIPHEKIHIDLSKGQQKNPEFLAVNPLGEVPCIDDDGYILWESEAIMKYLISSRNKGQELYPLDPKIRGNIDKYFPFHHSVLRPKLTKDMHFHYKFLFPHESFASEEVIKGEAEKALKTFDEVFLKDKKYINGDEMTIADLSAVNELSQNYFATDLDYGKYPRVKDYVERCLGNPVLGKTQDAIKAFPDLIKAYLASMKKE